MTAGRDAWVAELAAVSESIRAVTSSLELAEVLRLVLGRIKTLTEAEALSLLLHDAARGELVFAATETLRERTFAGGRTGNWWRSRRGARTWVARITGTRRTRTFCARATRRRSEWMGRY